MNECKTEELTELVIERNSIMQKALDASHKASQYMVKRELRRIHLHLQRRNRFDSSPYLKEIS